MAAGAEDREQQHCVWYFLRLGLSASVAVSVRSAFDASAGHSNPRDPRQDGKSSAVHHRLRRMERTDCPLAGLV
jgi:hypothetical protein